MIHVSYDIRAADESGVTIHPEEQMKVLGIKYIQPTPQSITDSWQFWGCSDVPSVLPKYLKIIEKSPMDFIGHGLSKEDAEKLCTL